MVSGQLPLLSALFRANSRSTTILADWTAAAVGIDWGSRAWMFLPVGNTSGLRMGSPPGPGNMYSPSKPLSNAPSSLSAQTCCKQNSKYSNRGFKAEVSTLG